MELDELDYNDKNILDYIFDLDSYEDKIPYIYFLFREY